MATYGISGSALLAEQIAQVAYQAGARGSDLEFLVGVAKRESGYYPTAHRTDSAQSALSGDRGLWQINYIWDQQLINAGIIRQKSDLFDPVTNAKAALYILSKQGRAAWSGSSGGWAQGGDPMYKVDLAAAQQAVQSAAAKGMLGQDWNSGSSSSGGGGPVPSDMTIGRINGQLYAMYSLGAGVWIRYSATPEQVAGLTINELPADWLSYALDAGSASEIAEVSAGYGTYGEFVNQIKGQFGAAGDPRFEDPGVMRVLAAWVGRPDMTEAEFENLLKGTNYYQLHTEEQLAWNDLSEAERNVRLADMQVRMAQTWLTYVGENVSTEDPRIRELALDVASGKMGFGQWTETYLKPRAAMNPESPWSRQLRDEAEAQLERGVSIENTVSQLRAQLVRWGLQWGEDKLLAQARGLVEKKLSDDDVNGLIRAEANAKYPWKDPNMETVVAAAPWIDTYNTVMERQGSLETEAIQQALATGESAWDFRQRLRGSAEWRDTTKGARDESYSALASLGQEMGFAS